MSADGLLFGKKAAQDHLGFKVVDIKTMLENPVQGIKVLDVDSAEDKCITETLLRFSDLSIIHASNMLTGPDLGQTTVMIGLFYRGLVDATGDVNFVYTYREPSLASFVYEPACLKQGPWAREQTAHARVERRSANIQAAVSHYNHLVERYSSTKISTKLTEQELIKAWKELL